MRMFKSNRETKEIHLMQLNKRMRNKTNNGMKETKAKFD